MRRMYRTILPLTAFAVFALTAFPVAAAIENPLGNVTSVQVIIGNVISALLAITGSLALAMFVWGGFLWVTSAGNQEKVKKGKDAMLWATVGLLVILFSYTFIVLVVGALTGGATASEGQPFNTGQVAPIPSN